MAPNFGIWGTGKKGDDWGFLVSQYRKYLNNLISILLRFLWINSWGEYWGEDGWFRVERGTNALAIEEACFWAKPKAWGHLIGNATSPWDEKNYDERTVEAFHKTLIKKSLVSQLSSAESESPSHTSKIDDSNFLKLSVGVIVGAVLLVAAFVGGGEMERRRLYQQVSTSSEA